MKKGTLIVTVRKKDYEVKYQLAGGVIEFYDQDNEKHSKLVYKKASEIILDELEKQPEKVAEMKKERIKKENDSKIENDVKAKIDQIKKEATMEFDALNGVDIKTRKLLDRLEALEEENRILRSKQAKVGRKSIGVTRKISLVLPQYLWDHVDMVVRLTKKKQNAVIREMIIESFVNYKTIEREINGKGDKE